AHETAAGREVPGLLGQHPDRNSTDTARVHLFCRQLARARGVPSARAAPAARPGAARPGRAAAPTDPPAPRSGCRRRRRFLFSLAGRPMELGRSGRAVGSSFFFFAFAFSDRGEALGRSGRALMRPRRGARYRGCLASTPIATAPTLLSLTSFVAHS